MDRQDSKDIKCLSYKDNKSTSSNTAKFELQGQQAYTKIQNNQIKSQIVGILPHSTVNMHTLNCKVYDD